MADEVHTSSAENPETFTGLNQGSIQKSAAGVPAIVSSIREVIGKAGVVRGWKALSQLNKKGGFDCPSCAWPDPDDERRRADVDQCALRRVENRRGENDPARQIR